jgi:hypothetical protein
LRVEVERIRRGDVKRGSVPPLWDGHTADRIVQVVLDQAR